MKFKTIFFFWAMWRIGLFLLSALAIIILPNFGNKFPYVNEMLKSSGLPAWFWQFGNFDGVHYIGIAKDGYMRQFTQAFFPMFPILIRLIAPIFLNNFVVAGVFLSSVFTLLSAGMLNKLIGSGQTWKSVPTIKNNNINWIVLFFLFFPMSFFFGAIYNESFFLFCILSSFYFAKKENYFLAGIFGMLASATRLVGVFLLPGILYEMIVGARLARAQGQVQDLPLHIKNIFFILLIPLGLFLYMVFLQLNFHDALYFLHSQGAFGASRSTGVIFPLVTVWRYVKILISVPIFQYNFWVAFWEAGFFVAGGILLTIITILKCGQTRRSVPTTLENIDVSYLIFSWGCFLLPVFTGTLSSFPRYFLVCFPIYIFLGNISKKSIKILIFSIFLILNSIFLILFARGYWVS